MNNVKGGYAGKILKVNLSTKKIESENLSEDWVKNYIGGRGFVTKYLFENMSPDTDPLSPFAPLIFATGPLTGIAPSAGRLTIGARSPLTKIHGDSNVGGEFGVEMKKAGYDVLIITGKAENPVYLEIADDKIEIKEANWLWGKNTIETTKMLLEKFGDREAHVACIGPAGEHLVYVAGICVDAGRYAAECGLGAVMGSKNLKAILAKGTNGIKIENVKEFKRYFGKTLALYESEPTTNLARKIGSNLLLKIHNDAGALVWRNLQYSGEELGKVTGENINKKYVTKNRSGCYLCSLGCARHMKIDKGVYKGTVYNVPEYYTVDSVGPRLGIKDLENIFYNSELCDQLGLDSSSAPSIIGFVMECYQRKIITKEDVDGLDLSWGNGKAVTILLKKIAYREGVGNILADGIIGVIKKFGPDSEKYAMHIKGLDIPCKDPRAGQTYGMRYAISTRGADHERCSGVSSKAGEIVLNIDDLPPEDSMKIFISLEKYVTEVNLMNVCNWAWSSYSTSMDVIKKKEQYILGIFNSATGLKLSQKDIDKATERTILSERAENARYGMRRKDDYPPKRILEEPLTIIGGRNKGKNIPPCYNFDERLDYYYKYRGIDSNTAIPLEFKLKELGMHKVIDELRKLKK